MKVLFINHEFPPIGGGAGSASKQIAEEVARLGIDVTFITAAYQDLSPQETLDGIRLIRTPAIRTRQLEATPVEIASFVISAARTALRVIRQRRPDLVHAFFGVPSGAIGWALSRLTGVPFLISLRGRDVHGGKEMEAGGISGILRAASRIVWRDADALIANSAGLRQIARQVAPRAKVGVIPNGIDTDRFTPGPRGSGPDGPVRLLFVGRLEPYKALTCLFEALRLLREDTDGRVILSIAGDGSLRTELPRAARRLGVADLVHFAGPVPNVEMPGIYRDADIFVLPSLVEGMPNVILEAMASGLPVVATRIPGSEELVRPGKTGLLVPPSDPQSLAHALRALSRDGDLRRRMGQNARNAAGLRSWARIADAYVGVYGQVLGRPGLQRQA